MPGFCNPIYDEPVKVQASQTLLTPFRANVIQSELNGLTHPRRFDKNKLSQIIMQESKIFEIYMHIMRPSW